MTEAKTTLVPVVVTKPAFYGGVQRKPGDKLKIVVPEGTRFPSWAQRLPDDAKSAQEAMENVLKKLAANHSRPALATMSEINRANADLMAAMGASDTTPPTAAQAAVAAAAAEKAAAAPAALETPTTPTSDAEDLLR